MKMNKEPTIVVDSNVLIKWYIPEKYSEQAVLMRNDYLYGRIRVISPTYALLEFANTLRKYVIRKLITHKDVLTALNLLLETRVEYISIFSDYMSKVLKYSMNNNVTVYDAYYIVLAKENNAYMYTADEKLLDKVKNKEPLVRHIKDYPRDRIELLGIKT